MVLGGGAVSYERGTPAQWERTSLRDTIRSLLPALSTSMLLAVPWKLAGVRFDLPFKDIQKSTPPEKYIQRCRSRPSIMSRAVKAARLRCSVQCARGCCPGHCVHTTTRLKQRKLSFPKVGFTLTMRLKVYRPSIHPLGQPQVHRHVLLLVPLERVFTPETPETLVEISCFGLLLVPLTTLWTPP